MDLGRFSVSLTVKDIKKSRAFYEKMGFRYVEGNAEHPGMPIEDGQDWLILQNGTTIIGLFQGMFDDNILTFNPTDVRSIQKTLKAAGVKFTVEADESTNGPASAMLEDPDGNTILIDQHND